MLCLLSSMRKVSLLSVQLYNRKKNVCVCFYVYPLHNDAHGGQKWVWDCLEVEGQALVNFLMWILGSEFGSSAMSSKGFSPLNHPSSPLNYVNVFLGTVCIPWSSFFNIKTCYFVLFIGYVLFFLFILSVKIASVI